MPATVSAPIDWVETLSAMKLPRKWDKHLQTLMDRNNEGSLNESEIADLESLAEWSEELSLVRAQALQLLERAPE
jgi:hypothetical protein